MTTARKATAVAVSRPTPGTLSRRLRAGSEALALLSAIGAKRTARWLRSALDAPGDWDALARLDQRFCEKAQDLASLAIAHVKKRSK